MGITQKVVMGLDLSFTPLDLAEEPLQISANILLRNLIISHKKILKDSDIRATCLIELYLFETSI
jgi:hypothetical protein